MYHVTIMKSTPSLFLLLTLPALAQSSQAQSRPPPSITPPPPTHRAAPPACAKLPELSSSIPALPANLPCAKVLYTITTTPSVKLDFVSPLEGPGFAEKLGIESSSFSLAYTDIAPGTGELAAPHRFYGINYTGYLVDGTKFDSNLDHASPLVVEYGKHQVIPGWDTGFAGMRVGGKRRLYIPYQLAYGPNGKPPSIPDAPSSSSTSSSSPSPTRLRRPRLPPSVRRFPASGRTRPRSPPLPPPHPAQPPTPPAQPGSAQSVVGKPTTTARPHPPPIPPGRPLSRPLPPLRRSHSGSSLI